MNEDAIISQICFPTAVNNQTDFNNLQNKYDETMPEEPQPNVHEQYKQNTDQLTEA